MVSDGAFRNAPLSRESVEDGAPLLLIFDGLDELVTPGEAAKDVVLTFANRLHSLVANIQGNSNRLLKVVVSGRMPAFQAASRYLTPPRHGAIETRGFLPLQSVGHEDAQWTDDQRITWWEQYSLLKGMPTTMPEAFANPRLAALTNEPLLCYLLALAGFSDENWELAADNRNRIYESLIDSIYERGWGDGAVKRLGPGRTLTKADFLKLMETIALAAWLGGDARVASEEKFSEAIEITDASRAWLEFTNDNGQDVTNLAMNFYLKSSERDQRGFEFTHKSFGEYLAARALIGISREVAEQVRKKPDYAMLDWFKATRTGNASHEMLTFLRDQFRLDIKSANRDQYILLTKFLKASFEILIGKVAEEGFPIAPGTESWRVRETEQGNAECCLWMVANACAYSLADADEDNFRVDVQWTNTEDLSSVLQRLLRIPSCIIILACLSYLNARSQTLVGFRANGASFYKTDLRGTTFAGTFLLDVSFQEAWMDGCRFYACNLQEVNFAGAMMRDVKLHVTRIRGATFTGVREAEIYISPLTLLTAQNLVDLNMHKDLALMLSVDDDLATLADDLRRKLAFFEAAPSRVFEDLIGDLKPEGTQFIDDPEVDNEQSE